MSRKTTQRIFSLLLMTGMLAGLVSPVSAFFAQNALETIRQESHDLQSSQAASNVNSQGPSVSEVVVPKISREVRDLPRAEIREATQTDIPLRNFFRDRRNEGTDTQIQDPLASESLSQLDTPAPLLDFEGMGDFDLYTPPDTTGDVGPNHYIQIVNVFFSIYDKAGTQLAGPIANNELWNGFGGPCETTNDGDPIVLYDDWADRWLISQFAVEQIPEYQCIAISTSPDPLGSYNLYAFSMPDFPDYPKFGVWLDGYYMSTNTGFPNQYYAHVFDRTNMLAGNPATRQSFGGIANFLMPADADGLIPPPAGSPEYFYTFYKDGYPGHPSGVDRLAIYEFEVDWVTPANSTFSLVTELPIAAFNYTVCGFFIQDCIPQPGTSQTLDSLSYWPMVRMQYRNFGAYEAMVSNFTVDLDGTDKAAIRWFELRKDDANPWGLYQEGTYAPDSDHRWMGSIAMDGSGNIALGYSVSSSTTNPAIRYATRYRTDPLGTLQAEASLIEGGGVNTGPFPRWGDYSAMNVDPTDQCTFWITNEYHDVPESSFLWNTRIGAFKLPGCTGSIGPTGTLEGTVTDASTTLPILGANVEAVNVITPTISFNATTDVNGDYSLMASVGIYDVTASAYGYLPETMMDIEILSGTVTVQDFALNPAPSALVYGYVTDVNTGWPLYASIDIAGYPGSPIWTDPVSGYYEVSLPEEDTYFFHVEAFVDGYLALDESVGPVMGDMQHDFALDVDNGLCVAPGYVVGPPSEVFSDDFESGYGNWSMTGLWNEEAEGDACGAMVDPFPSPVNASYYGIDGTCTFDNRSSNSGSLTFSSPIAMPAGASLSFSSYEETECGGNCSYDNRYVEISTNGVNWTTVGEADTENTWYQPTFDLSGIGGGTDLWVRLRFDTIDNFANEYFGWMVDDVSITGSDCIPQPGGLVVGNVYEDLFNMPLTGAQVTNDGGESAVAKVTADPAVDDAFYTIFSPAGSHVFTATMPKYNDDVETVDVVSGDNVEQDFYLSSGELVVDPTSLSTTLTMGETDAAILTLSNVGTGDAFFEISERDNGFVPGLTLDVYQPPEPSAQQSANLSQFGDAEVNREGGVPFASPLDVILDQAPNQVNGLFADSDCGLCPTGQQTIAENFLVSAPVSVGQINFWTGYFPGDVPIDPDLITVIFHQDSGGVPGPAIYTEANVSYTRMQTGVIIFGVHEWLHTLTLDSPVDLDPGIYWVEIFNDTAGSSENFFWETGNLDPVNGLPGSAWTTATPGQTWNYDGATDLAIQLVTGVGADVTWLSEEPISGTILAGASEIIDVTFDATGPEIQPGDYFADILIDSDTPYPRLTVPVTMTVLPSPNLGKLEGTVTGLGYCDADPGPLEGSEVTVESWDGTIWNLVTDEFGYYSYWIDAGKSPLSVTVTYPEHESGLATDVMISAGMTTTVDFDLRWLKACLSVDPNAFDVTVGDGFSLTRELELMNDGAIFTTFVLSEQDGGFVPALNAVEPGLFSEPAAIGPMSIRSPEAQSFLSESGINVPLSWNNASPLPMGLVRYAHAQCDDSPDSFYVISGVSNGSIIDNVWRYDADTDTWNTLAPIPSGSEGPSAVCYEGYVYVAGGDGTNQFYIYDIAADSWSSGTPLPRPVWGAAMGASDGNVYMIGGDNDFFFGGTSNAVDIYDVAAGTWSSGSPMPLGVVTAGQAQAGDYVYVVGGWFDSSPGSNSNVTQRYDMSSDTWETGPTFTSARADLAVAITVDGLYAIGGDANGGGAFDASSTVEVLDWNAWPGGSWADAGDPLPVALTANNAGFCTNAVTSGEIWSTGGIDLTFSWHADNQYRPSEACFSGAGDILWLIPDPVTGTVEAGSNAFIDLIFDASSPTITLGTYTGTLTVRSDDPVNPRIGISLTLHVVEPAYGVELSGDQADEGIAGEIVMYTMTVTNTSNGPSDTFDVSVGSSVFPALPSVTEVGPLAAEESATFQVAVEIPELALLGESDAVEVTVTSQNDATKTDSATLTTSVSGVLLSADSTAKSGPPGGTVAYTVYVTNTGSLADTIVLTYFDVAPGWTVHLVEDSFDLAAGESAETIMHVYIPIGADIGDSDVFTLQAASTNDPSLIANLDFTTTVVSAKIYLPYINKP